MNQLKDQSSQFFQMLMLVTSLFRALGRWGAGSLVTKEVFSSLVLQIFKSRGYDLF